MTLYATHSFSDENGDVHIQRVQRWTLDGEARNLTFTDKQLERMRIFTGKRRISPEQPPNQFELF